jgi:hypothetical protein
MFRRYLARFGKGTASGFAVGLICVLPFAVALGFLIGGNFGGGYGEYLAGAPGVIIGLVVGILSASGIVLIFGGIAGYWFSDRSKTSLTKMAITGPYSLGLKREKEGSRRAVSQAARFDL